MGISAMFVDWAWASGTFTTQLTINLPSPATINAMTSLATVDNVRRAQCDIAGFTTVNNPPVTQYSFPLLLSQADTTSVTMDLEVNDADYAEGLLTVFVWE